MALTSLYLFLLGLSAGMALLTITSYRRVSPAWLKWVLIAAGIFVISRYVTMALFTSEDAPQRFWALRRCWFATSLSLPLASIFAVDQLVRHPAMTPKKLLCWYTPFLVAYGAVILFGTLTPTPDRFVGWTPQLTVGWRQVLALTHGVFVVGFVGVGILLIRKLPVRSARCALLGLIAAVLLLALDGIFIALGSWYFRPYLYSEIIMLLALWHAFETAAALQQSALSL